MRRDTNIRADLGFKKEIERIKREVAREQDADLSTREVTRRMANSASFRTTLREELLQDARAKRRLGIR